VILPARQLVITSAASPAELLRRVGTLIGPGLPFDGEVSGSGFTARRRRTLARFGLPVASGSIRADDHGSSLEVDLRLDPSFVVLYSMWAAVMLAASAALVRASVQAGALQAGSLGPAALVAFVHAMVFASFAGESALLRRYLETLARSRAAA
jgi:hypothetical protein